MKRLPYGWKMMQRAYLVNLFLCGWRVTISNGTLSSIKTVRSYGYWQVSQIHLAASSTTANSTATHSRKCARYIYVRCCAGLRARDFKLGSTKILLEVAPT